MNIKTIVNPKQTAVLVIDIQNDYCSPEGKVPKFRKLDTSPIEKMIPKLNRFTDIARDYHVPIIWTQMIEDYRYVAENLKVKMRLSKSKLLNICTPGTWGYDFYKLRPKRVDKIFVKKHYDAFTNFKLEKYLKQKKIKTLIITGIYTSRCVDSTIRSASARGYHIIVPEDLVAMAKEHKNKHKSSLEELGLLFAHVIKSKDILKLWKG